VGRGRDTTRAWPAVEAVDVTHDREDRGRDDETDARDREQPPGARVIDDGLGDRPLDRGHLRGQDSEVAADVETDEAHGVFLHAS
jgi:hypothetical protein